MLQNGYVRTEMTEPLYMLTISPEGVVARKTEEEIAAIERANAPQIYTRLQIRRACRALGLEEKLDTLLSASEEFAKEWNDCLEVNWADPILQAALTKGLFTVDEIEQIIHAIGEN